MIPKEPAISVLMPVYNAEKYVAEAVESILNQTFKDFEFIIINDGSTDGSLAILEKYTEQDKRIRLVSRENKGLVTTLNEGIELALAPYIARMDADDISLPERFEKQYEYMEAHPECVACGNWVQLIDTDGENLCFQNLATAHDEIDKCHMEKVSGSLLCHPAVIFRKTSNLVYDEKYIHAEDFELYLRLAEVGKLSNLPQVLLCYRVHSDSIGYTRRNNQLESIYKAIQSANARRGLQTPMLENNVVINKHPSSDNCLWAWWALKGGNIKTARKHAWRAFKRQPFNKESWRVLYCALRGY